MQLIIFGLLATQMEFKISFFYFKLSSPIQPHIYQNGRSNLYQSVFEIGAFTYFVIIS